MKTIRELKAVLKRKQTEINKLSDELQGRQLVKALPGLKRKYEGKYFKYDNGYNAEVRWWLYSHCHEIISLRKSVSTRFETTPDQCEFKIRSEDYMSTFQIEISKEEYDKAAVLFFESAKQILK